MFVCLQPDDEVRADTVGVPIEGVEIKVADSGEILVRSPGLLKEYYKNPTATAEVLDADGWYHTGDAGFLDAGGPPEDHRPRQGRRPQAAPSGAMFAPKYVENKLKFFPYIKEAVAFGDRRDKVCAFVNIDFEAVGNWAEQRNLPYAGYTDLAQKPEVLRADRATASRRSTPTSPPTSGWPAARSAASWSCTRSSTPTTASSRARARSGAASSASKYQVLVDALYGGKTEQYIETAGEVRGRPHRHGQRRR